MRNQIKDFHHCIAKEWLRNWEVILLPHFFPSGMDGGGNGNESVSIHKDNYTQPIPSIAKETTTILFPLCLQQQEQKQEQKIGSMLFSTHP